METGTVQKKSYIETNEVARSPTLQTVLMVEKFIEEHSGEYKKTELFNNLPRKVMWQTFQVIMEYLERSYRIIIEKDGVVTYIWNQKFYEKIKNMPDVKI
jgi:hypothetical protein